MARIFTVLAILAVLLLAANFLVGLSIGDFNLAAQAKRGSQNQLIDLERKSRGAAPADSSDIEAAKQHALAADEAFARPRWRMTLHMLLGSAAGLMTLLVSSVTVTYFIGTSRWCKEVCQTYGIEQQLAERSAQLKRTAFPWALAAILSVIVIVGLGAAADPSGANWQRSALFVMPHYLAAMVGLCVILAAFWMQISRIAENYRVIEEIMAEVQRLRSERNLPTEVPAA